jgi:hypothetical protein
MKLTQCVNKGMRRDNSISKTSNEFAFHNHNIRLTATSNETLLSVTNEKGNKKINFKEDNNILGTFIGHCVINNYLVIFTKEVESNIDRIYRISNDNEEYILTEIVSGELNFSIDNPIEALGHYEMDSIQKVYWVDGKNQPRVINIMNTYPNNATQFDFLPSVETLTRINVDKSFGDGYFSSGVIQYFISYFNKNGSETKIVATSPLCYSSFEDRGASPEESTNCVFNIVISDVDTSFEYIRLYSIFRTSLNSTVEAKIVKDFKITSSKISFTDSNTIGESIDPQQLLFTGGDYVIASTINQKDGTLFLGDLKVERSTITDEDAEYIKEVLKNNISSSYRKIKSYDTNEIYPYYNQMVYNSNEIKSFKGGEIYRIGIQFKNKFGTWTEPVYIKDYENTLYPSSDNSYIYLPQIEINIPSGDSKLNDIMKKYTTARVVYVEPNFNNRTVVAQGIINPTLFNIEERKQNKPWSIASWFTRPITADKSSEDSVEFRHLEPLKASDSIYGEIQNTVVTKKPYLKLHNVDKSKSISILYKYNSMSGFCVVIIAYTDKIVNIGPQDDPMYTCYDYIKHFSVDVGGATTSDAVFEDKIYAATSISREYIINFTTLKSSGFYKNAIVAYTWDDLDLTSVDDLEKQEALRSNQYYIDWNTITLNSPDIDEDSIYLDNKEYRFRIVGYVPITSNVSDYKIEASASIDNKFRRTLDISFNQMFKKGSKTNTLWSYPLWNDVYWSRPADDSSQMTYVDGLSTVYLMYPWHKSGSINGQDSLSFPLVSELKDKPISSILENKTFANKKISSNTKYFSKSDFWEAWKYASDYNTGISPIRIVNQEGNFMYEIHQNTEGLEYNSYKTYLGNYSKIVTTDKGYKVFGIDEVPIQTAEEYLDGRLREQSYAYVHDSCQVSFKSQPHAVFSFNKTKYQQTLIPPSNLIGDIDPNLQDITQIRLWYNKELATLLKDVGILKHIVEFSISQDIDNSTEVGQFILLKEVVMINPGAVNVTYYLYKKTASGDTDIMSNYQEITDTKMVLDNNGSYIYFDTNNNTTYIIIPDLIRQERYSDLQTDYNYVLLGELYHPNDNNISRYGDTSLQNLQSHSWIPISDEVSIVKNENGIVIVATEGDTYFQRWDCVKTLPNDGENNIIDITSFMVESRINLDGRYDKFRKSVDLVDLDYKVINNINKVYSQSNNYQQYFILNSIFDSETYKNQFTWSLSKKAASDIDTWTSVNLASSYALDGDKGSITSLQRFNNELIAFQEKGISQILFNSRTQLSTTEGVPVEIANSAKVDGVRYISGAVGCKNKWSIVSTPYGIYFIDDFNKSINVFNGQLNSLSDTKGFNTWIKENSVLDIWNPKTFKNFKTSYDAINKDVYFINGEHCLTYSELLNEFTSFMDYNGVSMIGAFNDKVLSYKDNNLWIQNEGEYNMFFGEHKPYSIEYRVAPNPYTDKIFNTVEYRADMWDNDYLSNNTFDSLEVFNEYQRGVTNIKDRRKYPNFEKKFRIWRVDIPRDESNNRDRIRNPWVHIRLNKDSVDSERMVFHNLLVYYYE